MDITASPENLLTQAPITVFEFFRDAENILRTSGREFVSSDVVELAGLMLDDFHFSMKIKLDQEGS